MDPTWISEMGDVRVCLLALQLQLFVLAPLNPSSATRCSNSDGNYANAGLTSVPPYQAGCDLFKLTLTGNSIAELHSGSFEGYFTLRRVEISRNQLTNVEEDAFKGAINLEFADLSHNHIRYLNKSFRNAKSLTDINLGHNEIRYLDNNSFEGAGTLEHINVRSNRISHVNYNTFFWTPKLQTLTVADNKIETLSESVFAKNRNITTIDLRNNRFHSFPLRIFDNLDNLRYLRLSGNRLISITFVFSTPSVVLQAENCDLAELPDITFSGSDGGVIEMDLRYNNVDCPCLILEITVTSNRTIKCVDEDIIGTDSIVTCFNKDVTTVSTIATTSENNQSTPRRSVIDELNENNTRPLLYLLIPATVVIIVFGLGAFYVRYNRRRTRDRRPDP